MDLETVKADAFGASLRGIGLNVLVRDVERQASFLTGVFGMTAHQLTRDFAIMAYHGQVMQIHADHTYAGNPLPSLLPEAGPRGAGAELRLYQSDPDEAARRAPEFGGHVLQAPKDKPHGIREAYILCENGYAWVASLPLGALSGSGEHG